ncbi:hypothetical protein [Coralloluteibacterium stylophorae]|uniref:DUF707 domain-containing protein n=1 Tax=Coralloluteibacterium stylophorae TaxID=1776034 RepID=A0A8J7VVW9_9GAMM|nr:hypothetical protein [Coralloluteibacterium stylophorae]MBS7455657.1 hypothetical protein [Coralloluteibacterium stylophorae]
MLQSSPSTAPAPARRWQPGGSRNLVLARVGDKSLHATWLKPAHTARDWDLHLSYYGSRLGPVPRSGRGLSWSNDPERSKFYGISVALERAGIDLDAYDYIALPDDDLVATVADWNLGFQLMRKHDLGAAQLSLNPFSFFGHLDTVHRPGLELRYVSLIELMAPIIRVDVFKRCLPYLRDHDNIWAMDHVLAAQLRDTPRAMAVLDAVSVLHTRSFWTGPLYAPIRAAGTDPHSVERRYLEAHGIERVERRTLGALTRGGRSVQAPWWDDIYLAGPRLWRKLRALRRVKSLADSCGGRIFLRRQYPGTPALELDRRRQRGGPFGLQNLTRRADDPR